MVLASLLELLDDLVAFRRRGVDRHQIVVVEVHAPGADLGQGRNDPGGSNGGAHGITERIAATISQRPQSKKRICALAWVGTDRSRWHSRFLHEMIWGFFGLV